MTLTLNKHSLVIDPEVARSADGYLVFDPDLIAAADAAIGLGKPLLLTGEPGIGKSEFANWLAAQPEPCALHRFVVKSTTEGNDLFYRFDTLARFRDAQVEAYKSLRGELQAESATGASSDRAAPLHPLRYLRYDALGKAILFSLGRAACEEQGLISASMGGEAYLSFPEGPTRSVVLIDEIDKAPRDVPNDILDEIDRLSFRVSELDNAEVKVNPGLRPIIVITSNSERDLPKPFLRRCVYYHMRFPESDEILRKIAVQRVGRRYEGNDTLLGQALKLFRYLRNDVSLNHQPGLAELLDWLADLAAYAPASNARLERIPQAKASLKNTLLKDKDDQALAGAEWDAWLKAIATR
jgi:MoxR-like ATPase